MALLALRRYSESRRPSLGGGAPPVFALRLLIARHCQNTTPQGLAEAVGRFPNLAFLDVSWTLAVRDRGVLERLGGLALLQVLKLRNVHLRDEDVVVLAGAIGKRVRSLDVSENDLTDQSVRTLLGSCFDTVEGSASDSSGLRDRAASNMPVEDWPSGFVRPDPAVLDEFRDESYNERFVRRLTSRVVSRLPFEDLPQSGITHLYIAGNQLSVEGLAALIRSKKLYVLDAGSVNTARAINRPRSNSSKSPGQANGDQLDLPGLEKLNPVLARCGQEMTSLRIGHSIVTSKAPPVEEDLPLAVCELAIEEHRGRPEMEAAVPQIAELDDTEPPTYELDSREVAPAYEMPAAPVDALSPVRREKPLPDVVRQEAEVHRGSVYSPEVANHQEGSNGDDDNNELPVLTATGLGSMAQAVNGIIGPTFPLKSSTNTAGITSLPDGDPNLSRALLAKQRQTLRVEQMGKKPHGLVPAMLPQLRNLTLIDVPCHDDSKRTVVNALIAFIQYCAAESSLAAEEARLESPNAHRKPGGGYHHHHNQAAPHLQNPFPLHRLTLEMAPPPPPPPPSPTPLSNGTLLFPHRQTPHNNNNATFKSVKYTTRTRTTTKSSTEDPDSEAMWSASVHDFTFFDDDEEEECGLPSAETDSASFRVPSSEKMVLLLPPSAADGGLPTLQDLQGGGGGGVGEVVDVVGEVAAFRRGRRVAFENAGAGDVVEGYWPGEVKVVRNGWYDSHDNDNDGGGGGGEGRVDYYGNAFGRGGVYR